jgi:hypothetical protein
MDTGKKNAILAGAGAAVIIFIGLITSYLLADSSGNFSIWGPIASFIFFIIIVAILTIPLWYRLVKWGSPVGEPEDENDTAGDA